MTPSFRTKSYSSYLVIALTLSSCSKFGGGLRKDFMTADMQRPTWGGRWAERRQLSEEFEEAEAYGEDPGAGGMYGSLAHRDRRPAGMLQTLSGKKDEEERMRARELARLRQKSIYDEGGAGGVQGLSNDVPQAPARPRRVKKEDFLDRNSNEGSLWASDGQTNYYFTKNKVRGLGDIVNIATEESLIQDIAREVLRSLSDDELKQELQLAQERLAKGGDTSAGVAASEANRQPAATQPAAAAVAATAAVAQSGEATPEEKEVREATFTDIDVRKSLALAPGEGVMAEIVERYPNGNYKVRGTKRVPYRNGYRLVTLTAIAKATDISEDDQLTSGKLYEYRVDVD